jgi:hypothetical protein
MRAIDREICTILRGIIEKKDRAIKSGEASSDDLLGLLLESNRRESNGKEDLGMSTEDIIEECKLFYFAGMETTSVLLTWTLIVLSMHPEWQEQARKEVLHHFGRTTPDFENLSRLKIVSEMHILCYSATAECTGFQPNIKAKALHLNGKQSNQEYKLSNMHTPIFFTGCPHIYVSEGNTYESVVVEPKRIYMKQTRKI